ncbi:tRNA (adenine(37)-N6)-methyltransferase isoform X3 [Ochotona curzoniae]|uniref:tRNA (adenine(37)-N6)-methyltransferase isoform X3 n=1 Tax=Ochotona curzoniae TaxID=130825 RepID=UPI001B34710B|nr:tRNA (adenine(37)-N6)-methyltransferase isoform X3 [Ochotona curzoniae]
MRGQEEPGPARTATACGCVKPALETGKLLTEPIGYLESCFVAKNGTPRQPSICSHSRACLKIRKSVFNNPEHSLMGLEQFSHVWILFVFHKNGHLSCKAKVQPPRLNGAKTGVFSTRSPHRPNAIGLTLAKLDKVEGGAVYLSGIDMIHGTPVLDIKPYIADYDSPQSLVVPVGDCESRNDQQMPEPPSQCDGVGQASFKYFRSAKEAKCAIEAVLAADPRSVYRRQLCQDRLFFFTVDVAHVTCWFGEDFVEVLRVKLAAGPVPLVGDTSVALPSASVSS